MALSQAFTDASGNEYPSAHWRAVQINIAAPDRSIYLVFYAYKDLAAFGSGKQPLPGGVKSYHISGASFLAIASAPPQGNTMYDALAAVAEDYAVATKDTPTGENDENGKPILASFFANSVKA